jgi:hypothetical protein
VLLGTAILGCIGTWAGSAVLDDINGHPWLTSILLLVVFVSMAAAAGGTVSWLSLMWMADNAKTRAQTIKIRRQRLARHVESPAPADSGTGS